MERSAHKSHSLRRAHGDKMCVASWLPSAAGDQSQVTAVTGAVILSCPLKLKYF